MKVSKSKKWKTPKNSNNDDKNYDANRIIDKDSVKEVVNSFYKVFYCFYVICDM